MDLTTLKIKIELDTLVVGFYGQLAGSTPYLYKWVAPAIVKPTYLKVR